MVRDVLHHPPDLGVVILPQGNAWEAAGGHLTEVLVSVDFEGEIIEWRGPAPFLFVQVPEQHFGEIRFAAREVSYGWGVVPVSAEINGHGFTTALFPRGDAYLLPVKVAVQRAARVGLGERVEVSLWIESR